MATRVLGAHAATDVTGFGLAGHLLEICRGSKVGARIYWDKVPVIPGTVDLARQGHVTGASSRNWSGYGNDIVLAANYGDLERNLITDPQTSGGLLVACASSAVDEVLAIFAAEGFSGATVIGEMAPGAANVHVE